VVVRCRFHVDPLYDGRKACFRLGLIPQEQVDEEDLVLAALSELDEEHAVSKKVRHRMITCTPQG